MDTNETLLKTISDQIIILTSLVLRNNKEIDELKLLNEVKKTESFDPYEDYKEHIKLNFDLKNGQTINCENCGAGIHIKYHLTKYAEV